MRVFDVYTFDIAGKVKIKDTKKHLDKMLAELGLKYEELSFSINSFMTDIGKLVEDYPCLAGYRYYYEPFRTYLLTSLTPKWDRGEIYAREEDRDAVFDIFAKIPRGYNVTGSVILHHIDWYGDGKNEPAIGGNDFAKGKANICDDYSVLSNFIHMMRQYDDGNKHNRLQVTVEATSGDAPRNTQDVIKKLEKYIGKAESFVRRCYYDEEQTKHFKAFEEEAGKLLEKWIHKEYSVDNNEYAARMSGPFIPALVDKKMIVKAFADSGFSIVNNGSLPGSNLLRSVDSHNFQYDVVIDRTSACQSFFRFYIFIRGCNFNIRSDQDVIFADSRDEAAGKLVLLAEFCKKLREEFGEHLAEGFGDTPGWFDQNA